VISRLYGLARADRGALEQHLLEMMRDQRPGDIVQALMDVGAMICRPRQPRCGICPLAAECAALASGTPDSFPEPRARKSRPHRYGTAWWTERDGYVWLVRRPAKGLLGGMPALPGTDWGETPNGQSGRLGSVRHVFTHFSLDLAIEARSEPAGDGWWQPLDSLDEAGLPTLYQRAAEVALGACADARAAA
jgi:A/G-specific adenine glycosylase